MPNPVHAPNPVVTTSAFAALTAVALALALPLAAHSAEEDRPVGPAALAAAPMAPASWFAIPVAFYMPETQLGLGAMGGVHFRFEPPLPVSDVQVVGAGTARHQALFGLQTQLFPSAAVAVGGSLRLSRYPDLFYGVGGDTPQSARVAFTSDSLEAQVSPEWYLVPGRLRSGPRAWFRQEAFRELAPGSPLAGGVVHAARGYASTALGWGLTWDTRDNRFAPGSGNSVEAWYLISPGAFGDRLRFGRGGLDARQFLPLGRAVVLGLAGHLELAHGDVPVTLLPRLGGDRNLRGYYEGRWRDRLLYSGQAELRFPVAGRFGATIFAGLSDVAHQPSGFEARTIRPAAGAGLRYRLTEDGLNIRLDVGVGQEGANLYFNLGEAF